MKILDRFRSKKSKEEKIYLDELAQNEQADREINPDLTHLTELKQQYKAERVPVKGKLFVDDPKYDIAYSTYNQKPQKNIKQKVLGGLDKIGGKVKDVGSYVGETEVGKYIGARAKGVVEYIPDRFKTATEDYETAKEVKRKHRAGKITSQKEKAIERGITEEELAYQKKTGHYKSAPKGTYDVELEKQKARIEIEKAGAIAGAKVQARLEKREQFQAQRLGMRDAMIRQSQVKRWPKPIFQQNWARPSASQIDPFGIFSVSGSYNPQQQQNQPRYNPAGMNSLLGYNPVQRQVPLSQIQLQQVQRSPRQVQQQAPIANTNNFVNQMLGFSTNQAPITKKGQVNIHKRNRKRKPVFNIFSCQFE